ncbi:PIG-L family deacetylase [Persicitalea jodogahamensis]|uniref:PIG-L domain-containing protein n=1 Tax=Persicitalea jodogahamensis TaxID=402147 RepID=A0A8J3D6T7_9BACT|nr:PIG-L family deacetylase [Persicitalea jodogahamensis]GHB81742.1 PIG-L domain-containing protein [Persicitalea jodogahamensis]
MKKIYTLFLCLLAPNISTIAQVPNPTSGEIFLDLKKLNVLGSAMHIAAHPDDENSLLLAYLAKERLVNTFYLALTRGDGGQNLIGSEQGEYIGIIRTQELLAARRTDGAQQLFTHAYDFGYSKTREETLDFWGKDLILGDVVYLIRKFRPDVLIARFPPDERAGHGHHNSSAYLAHEAFKISGDPTKFPEQLKYVKPWQPERIVWNTYSRGFQNNAPTDGGEYVEVDLSGYNPILGKSYSEIAASSRSMHKTQGFGSAPNINLRKDFMLHVDGKPAKADLFDDVDLSWNRVKNSGKVSQMIQKAIADFDLTQPSASVPALVEIYKELETLDSKDFYVRKKKEEVQELIKESLGLWFETNPADYSASPGGKATVNIKVVNRSLTPVTLKSIKMTGAAFDSTLNVSLNSYEALQFDKTIGIPKNLAITQPYWLRKPIKDRKVFQFDNPDLVGKPENDPELETAYTFFIEGSTFTFTSPWKYKSVDPSEGEIYRPFELRPAVTVNLSEQVFVFADQQPKSVDLLLKANEPNMKGKIAFDLPKGWKAEPAQLDFSTKDKYEEKIYTVKVTPPTGDSEGKMAVKVTTDRGTLSYSLRSVEFRHIPTQTLFPPAETELVKLNIKNLAKKIGYIAGAGDEVPAALRQMGTEVTMLDEKELGKDLSLYDAIVVGVRAYNTEDRLGFYQQKLLDYVKNGGTMVVQYATARNGFLSNGLKVENMGPYPFDISRDRVTDENATMKFLNPNEPLLNNPNTITQKDFEGWIQERGLYFASGFEKNYTPVFASKDPGEEEQRGSLIYTKYGKGIYIYTGISFFRELPAGVPGAYRLFANLISAGK